MENNNDSNVNNNIEYTLSFSLFVNQINPLMKMGYVRPLNDIDIGTLPLDTHQKELMVKFSPQWEKELLLDKKDRSLWRVLFKTVGYYNIFLFVLYGFIALGTGFSGPLLLRSITNHFTGDTLSDYKLWGLIILSFLIPICGSVINERATLLSVYAGVRYFIPTIQYLLIILYILLVFFYN